SPLSPPSTLCRSRHIEPAVQRCDMRNRRANNEWKMQIIDVKMNHIELVGVLKHPVEHNQVMRHVINTPLIQPKRAGASGNQSGLRDRVATCEKSHVVSIADQFFSKIRNDPCRPSIMFWRHAFN